MDLLSLTIVGTIASVITQYIKRITDDDLMRAAIAIVISLIVGAIANVINYIPSVREALIGTIVFANLAYQILVKNALKVE
jgi:uncharacterized membrane protein